MIGLQRIKSSNCLLARIATLPILDRDHLWNCLSLQCFVPPDLLPQPVSRWLLLQHDNHFLLSSAPVGNSYPHISDAKYLQISIFAKSQDIDTTFHPSHGVFDCPGWNRTVDLSVTFLEFSLLPTVSCGRNIARTVQQLLESLSNSRNGFIIHIQSGTALAKLESFFQVICALRALYFCRSLSYCMKFNVSSFVEF